MPASTRAVPGRGVRVRAIGVTRPEAACAGTMGTRAGTAAAKEASEFVQGYTTGKQAEAAAAAAEVTRERVAAVAAGAAAAALEEAKIARERALAGEAEAAPAGEVEAALAVEVRGPRGEVPAAAQE